MFESDDGKSGIVRSTDVDSGNVVSIKKYPSINTAKNAFDKVQGSREQSQPTAQPAAPEATVTTSVPPSKAIEPFLTPEWRANRKKEITERPGAPVPNGEKQRALIEKAVEEQINKEIEMLTKYPPGTKLMVGGYEQVQTVMPDGKLLDASGRTYAGNAGTVLKDYEPEQIRVISSLEPKVKQSASMVPEGILEVSDESSAAEIDRRMKEKSRDTVPRGDLKRALNRWKGDPSSMQLLISDIQSGQSPSSQNGVDAASILNEVSSAPMNPVTLYRGDSSSRGGVLELTSDRNVAEGFAKRYGGQVTEFPAGTIQALNIEEATGRSDVEKGWIGLLPDPNAKNKGSVSPGVVSGESQRDQEKQDAPKTKKGGDPNEVEAKGRQEQANAEAQADAKGQVGSKEGQAAERKPPPASSVSEEKLRKSILDAMIGEKKAPASKDSEKPAAKSKKYSPSKEPSEAKKAVQNKKQEAVKDYDEAKQRFRDAFNKAKGTNLSNAPLTPEYIELLSATADMMVQGIRVKAWSFAEIVADLVETFGRENIPSMREYLERGWNAAVEIEGVKPANYDKVFKEAAIPTVSNDEFADGAWDMAHAGLASEAVQRAVAVGMEGIDGRIYGIREQSPGKWQMVSKPDKKKVGVKNQSDKLKQKGLKVERVGSRWVVSGKTFNNKQIIKDAGGQYDANEKNWWFKSDPTDTIAARLPDRGDGKQSSDGGDSDADVERKRVRLRESERPDERGTSDSAVESVGDDTKRLIQRGEKFGIPKKVLEGQVEDIGRVTQAFEASKPMFLVGSAPGMGKSFILGGSIAEIRKRIQKAGGKPRFIYVTENQELISQLNRDLADYGVDDVEFVTYAGVRGKRPNASGSVVLIDEAHNAKNLETKNGEAIQAMVSESDFTVYATATPFENVAEAKYLEASGVFDGVEAVVKRKDDGGKPYDATITGFDAWAFAYGAELYWPKNAPRPVIYWHKHTTAEEGQIQANDWMAARGVYTQRPMVLPPEMVKSDLRAVTVDDKYAKMFEDVLGAYAEAEAKAENAMEAGMIRAHGINLQKRILEASKVKEGVLRAEQLIADGKQVIIFVNTKADRAIGRYRLSEPYRKHHKIKGEAAEKLYAPEQIADMMDDYQRAKRAAKQMGDDAGPAPFAKPVATIAEAMGNRGIDFSLPSVTDELLAAFPDGKSMEYTGRLTDAKAKENLGQWKTGKADVIIATMDKGGTGLSYHDTTGKMPERVQVNINLPWSGTQVEQVSGRLARLGTAKPVGIEWIFADNIPFERELSKTVGSRMRSMQAAVQGSLGDMAQSIKDFDFGDAPAAPESQQDATEQMHYPDGAAYRKWMDRKHRIGDTPTSWLSGHSSDKVREAAKNNPGLGLVITPATKQYIKHGGDYSHIMVDNGAFSEFTGTSPFSEDKFFAMLDAIVAAGLQDKVQHVVVPDRVGDWKGTTERWKEFYERVKAYGMPLAYVGQDGIEEHTDQIPWDEFDVFFIGGSTPWKLGYNPKGKYKDFNRPTDEELRKAGFLKAQHDLIKEAKRRGKRVHMGRVNSWKRMELANYGMQVDSADGNFIGAAPDNNLPIVVDWLKETGGDMFRDRVQQIQDTFPVTLEQAIVADILFDAVAIPGEIEIALTGPPPSGRTVIAQQSDNIDADAISVAVLDKMSRRLKSMGYDSRGAEDVRRAIKQSSLLDNHPDYIAAYQFATGSEQSRKNKAVAKKDLKNVNWSRLRELGTTTDPKEAGYIKPDGTYADLSGKREGGPARTRSLDHREAGGTAGMQEVMAYGWVRMDDNSGSIDIAKSPTSQQLSVISSMAQRHNGELVVDLEDGLGEWSQGNEYYRPAMRRWSQQYPEGTKPQRIINDIKKFFDGDTPNTLFQDQRGLKGAVMAWTHFVNASKAVIGATDKADVSSFFHELGHPMRKFLFNRDVSQEERGNITDADILKIEEFVGVKDGEWTRPDEEKFVDALMSYWMEGKAPTKQLETIFQKISKWLSDVISVIQRKVELTDDVRAIFDKVHQRGGVDPKKLQALREASKESDGKALEQEKAPKFVSGEVQDVLDDLFGDIAPSEARVEALEKIKAAGIEIKQTKKGWSVTGLPTNLSQEMKDGIKAEGGRRTANGYFFKNNPTSGLVPTAEAITNASREADEAAAAGLVRTPIGNLSPENAERYEEAKQQRLELAKQMLNAANNSVDELLGNFIAPGKRGLFKISLQRAAETGDPDSILGFDKMIDYSVNHPELGLPQDEQGLFERLLQTVVQEGELEQQIDEELANELASAEEDTSFDFGFNLEPEQLRQTAIEGLEDDVARKESSELFDAKQDKYKQKLKAEIPKMKQQMFLTDIYGNADQGTLFDTDGVAQEDDDLLFQAAESPVRQAGRVLKSAIDSGVTTFEDFIAHAQTQLRDDQIRENAKNLEELWETLRSRGGPFAKLGPVGSAADLLEDAEPESDVDMGVDEEIGDTVSPIEDSEETSIKNENVNKNRAKRGVDALPDVASQTRQEWLDAADEMLQDDPMVGDRLVKELNKNARNLSNIEVAVMQIHYRKLNNQLVKSSDRLFAAKDAKDAVASAQAMMDTDIIMNALVEMEEATKKAGREWGRAGVARQIELLKDFSQAALLRKARIANAGNALNAQQMEEIRLLSEKVAKLEGDLAKANQVKLDLERMLNTERSIKEEKERAGKPAPKSTSRQKAASKVVDFAKNFASIFGTRPDKSDTLYQTEDERMIEEAESVVQAYVDSGIYSFGEFIANIKKDLGTDIPAQAKVAFETAWKNVKSQGNIPSPTVDRTNARSMTRFARQIMRAIVESGIEKPEDVVNAVKSSLDEMGIKMTYREVMDAISGYGQYSPPSDKDIEKKISDIKGQLLELGKLADMEAGIAPSKTGVGRHELSPEHRELIRKVNIAKREGEYSVTDPDTQLKSAVGAAKTALTNRIYDLDRAINVTKKPIVGSEKKDLAGTDSDVIALRKQRDELMKQYKELFPKPKATIEQRIAATGKVLDNVIADLEKQIKTGVFDSRKKSEPISTQELDAKRARIEALRAERASLDGFKERTKEQMEKAYKANLLKKIADYKDMALNNYFDPKPKKEARELSKEEVALKMELQDAKDEFFRLAGLYRLQNMSPKERAWDYVKETAHLSRALMTSFDFSAVFRQGGAIAFAHPKMAKETSMEMYKAMLSDKETFKLAENIRNDDMYQFAMTAGLSITEEEGKITKQEEAYMGRWARLGIGAPGTKLASVSKTLLFPVSASARGYMTFLNGIRFKLFKHMVANLGKGGQVTADEAKVIAMYINAATGRSDLGPMMRWAEQANMLFFAPRFVASRFQYLGMPLWLLGSRKVSGRVKKAIAMEYIRHATGVGSFLALTVALGSLLGDDDEEKPTVSLDPRSSDFLKIKLGETRIDPMSGLSQVMVLLGRIASGQRVGADGEVTDMRGENAPYGGLGVAGTVGNFARTKLAPVPGAAFDIANGENVVGQPVTPFLSLVNLFIPLSLREIKETAESRGIPQGSLITLLSLHGMGASTYGPESNYRKGTTEQRKKQFDKDLKKMTFDSKEPAYKGLLSKEQMTEVAERREDRKQGLVYAASANPIRKTYKNEETYSQAVKERDAALESLRKSGFTLDDSRKLLIKHWESSYGSAREMRGGVRVYKEALSDRLKQLRKVYSQ
jgi:hypothetical protein